MARDRTPRRKGRPVDYVHLTHPFTPQSVFSDDAIAALHDAALGVLEREGKRIFHTHFFVDGHENVVRQLLFRDYLRAHRDEALAYEAIKREAAAAHPSNSLAYNDHKSAWILDCQERARAWAKLS